MKNLLLALIGLLGLTTSYAQQIWKKSWCTTQAGDTLHGQVLYKDWTVSPMEITFKDTISGVEKIFAARDIKRLTIYNNKDSESYAGAKVSYKKYQTESPLAMGQNPILSTDTLSCFLEILFESEVVILYRLLGPLHDTRFYLQKDAAIVELEYVKVQYYDQAKIYSRELTRYKQQLQNLLSECPTLNVTNVTYDAKSIIKLLKEYHSFCKVDFDVLFENNRRNIFNLGLQGSYVPEIFGERIYMYGLSLRYLMPKRFNNNFLIINFGRAVSKPIGQEDIQYYDLNYGLYVGTYFGKKKVQPFIYSGMSTLEGFLHTGIGISFLKAINLSVSTSPELLRNNAFEYSVILYPMFKGIR